jgi:Fe-S-cluster-containing dehydrogenase component
MTSLPQQRTEKRLGLVIDLDTCVGCHACVVNCKEWNTGGYPAPLSDQNAYGAKRTVYFPKSCLHCENAHCVTVCPTGASYKRDEDGIVLVDEDMCIGCGLCAWACPYGARELDASEGVMKKCTLCIDRIYNDNIPQAERVPACVATCPANARHFGDLANPKSEVSKLVASRGGQDLMPEMGYHPTNKYLPPRAQKKQASDVGAPERLEEVKPEGGFLGWIDQMLSR